MRRPLLPVEIRALEPWKVSVRTMSIRSSRTDINYASRDSRHIYFSTWPKTRRTICFVGANQSSPFYSVEISDQLPMEFRVL